MSYSQSDFFKDFFFKDLQEPIIKIAVAAGREILEISADIGQVEDKSDGSPLTRADMAGHNIICQGLQKLSGIAGQIAILSEEGEHKLFTEGKIDTFWCVDPLDGTKEFVKGLDEYTVNIALVDHGRSLFGVIYVPAKDTIYHAIVGQAAYKRQGIDGQDVQITARVQEKPTCAVASRSHLDEKTSKFLESISCNDVIRSGSSLKMCAVAEGLADIYPRFAPTCLWDTAAGAAICTAAGCDVLTMDAKAPLSYSPAENGLKREGFMVLPASVSWKRSLAGSF